MKTISPAMKSHLQGETTSLCTCWRIQRRDGTIMGFTDLDEDITYDDGLGAGPVVYHAASGFTPSAVDNTANLAVDNLDLQVLLDDARISEADLIAGVYDGAEVFIFMLNFRDLSMGDIKLRRGILGEITIGENAFVCEMRGLAQYLQQTIGRVHSAMCDTELGDPNRCKVDLGPLTVTAAVTGVTDNRIFQTDIPGQVDDYYKYGKLTFTTATNNSGREMEVKRYTNAGEVELFEAMPQDIVIGDQFTVYPGCDKLPATCQTKFSNFVNFQGFPHIPGRDRLLEYPDAF